MIYYVDFRCTKCKKIITEAGEYYTIKFHLPCMTPMNPCRVYTDKEVIYEVDY